MEFVHFDKRDKNVIKYVAFWVVKDAKKKKAGEGPRECSGRS